MHKRRVAIAQYRLLHYRVELFERLRARLAASDIELLLVHGQPTPAEAQRRDTGSLAWATEVHNRVLRVGGKDLLWQPWPAAARGCELVILMQENRLLSNYPWLFGWRDAGTRVAYWGHGRNFQSVRPAGWRERWKRWLAARVDWWFAYTELSAREVLRAGYPAERVTVLNNAIDNEGFAADLSSVSDAEVGALREQLRAPPDGLVAICCGSLYADKRLGLLLDAAAAVARRHPGFRLVAVGDGPARGELERARGKPWFYWAGAQHGRAKAAWFRAAELYLNPGAVGLHVLDSFVAGTPMVTTADALHGPEFAYLEHDVNGVVCAGTAAAYADAVLGLVQDPARLGRLRAAALAAAPHYTLDEMVRRFAEGIEACLAAPRLRR